MTKAEAEALQTQKNKEAQEMWCPFINNKCKYTCVCYSQGSLTNIKGIQFIRDWNKNADGFQEKITPKATETFDNGWDASSAGCTNVLCTGEIYADIQQ